MTPLTLAIYILACIAAGIVNTLAGGGSFLTFPALLMTGLDARAANITSTIALYPMQINTAYAGRKTATGTDHVSFKTLFIVSLLGGAVGGTLLLMTPSEVFGRLVPWFILFATAVFTWSAFFKKPNQQPSHHVGKWSTVAAQSLIGVYGGYFGAGIGILMLAALTTAGMAIKKAGATKNILAAVMNTSAAFIFLFSPDVAWMQAGVGIAASYVGSHIGLKLLHMVNEKYLRIFIIIWGLVISIFFFIRTQ